MDQANRKVLLVMQSRAEALVVQHTVPCRMWRGQAVRVWRGLLSPY